MGTKWQRKRNVSCGNVVSIRVKDMPEEQARTSLHKKIHVLLCCYHFQWHQLEYIKNRRDSIDVQMYHSQEGRYADIQ